MVKKAEGQSMINNYLLIDTLSNLSTKDDVISPGMSSTCATHIFQSWRCKFGQRFSYAGAMGAMGTGIPGAIGACIATSKRTICVNGDGGFQLNIQELEVVRRLKLNIKFFVLNNGGYAAIMNTQRKYFDSHYVGANKPDLTLPPLNKIADVYGLKYYLLEHEKDVQSICKQALSYDGAVLVEVIESDLQDTVMRVKSKMIDGKPVSGSFTDV